MARWAVAGFWWAAIGIVFDFLAESLYIGWLPEHLVAIQRLGTLLSGGLANGFYTFGGITLTLATPWGRRGAATANCALLRPNSPCAVRLPSPGSAASAVALLPRLST